MALVTDAPRRKHRIVILDQLSCKLVGLHPRDPGSGEQFARRSLPEFHAEQVIRRLPQPGRNGLFGLLLGGILLQKLPHAVFGLKVQGAAVHIPAGHQKAGCIAHPLALQQPDRIRRAHQAVGAGDLLKRVGRTLFSQVMHQQQGNVVPVGQRFQDAHVLIIRRIGTHIRLRRPHLL